MVRVRIVEPCQVPAAITGEIADHVLLVGGYPPQVLRRADSAGIAAAHADDRERLRTDPCLRHHHAGGRFAAAAPRRQVPGQIGRARVLEHDRHRKGHPGRHGQPPVQLDAAERVEAKLAERPLRVKGAGLSPRYAAEDIGDVRLDRVEQQRGELRRR
jgi:hypothetical protein